MTGTVAHCANCGAEYIVEETDAVEKRFCTVNCECQYDDEDEYMNATEDDE